MPKKDEYINFLKQLLKIQDDTEKAIIKIDRYLSCKRDIKERTAIIIENKQNHKKNIKEIIRII